MGKSKAPPPPDYAALATSQGEANLEAARLAGRLNNPNIYTPLGSREITFGTGTPSFDQAGFDQAMAAYNQQLQAYQSGGGLPDFTPSERTLYNNTFSADDYDSGRPSIEQFFNRQTKLSAPTAPNRDDYVVMGANDQPVIRESLTPEGQALFDQQMRLSQSYGDIAERGLGRLGEAFGSRFDPNMLPAIQDPSTGVFETMDLSNLPEVGDYVMDRQRVEQALFDRLNPQLDRQRQQREEELILRGQGMGGQAWRTTQEDLARAETESRLGAILGAGQEQQRLFDMANTNRGRALSEILAKTQADRQGVQAQYGLESQNRQRALQEALVLRQLPLSEINALRTGSQPTLPQFQPYQGQSVAPAPLFDAGLQQYNAALGATNAQNAQRGQTLGALAGLGAGYLSGGGSLGFGSLFGGGGGLGYFGGITP